MSLFKFNKKERLASMKKELYVEAIWPIMGKLKAL
jgi:hypothetical protein